MENKILNLCFNVSQPLALRKYYFFDIGTESDYQDDFKNISNFQRLANNCYLPANNMIYDLIKKYNGKFKVSYAISGVMLESLEKYCPEVLDSFRELAKTSCVEFFAEPYSHSLVSLCSKTEFKKQVEHQSDLVFEYLGVRPKTFCNTEMLYSDEIGEIIQSLGYNTIITEGAKHILGWKSPNFIYANPINPKLKLILRNYRLSDDLSLRFDNRNWSEWPLTAEKYSKWVAQSLEDSQLSTIFVDYAIFGEKLSVDTGIFDFMRTLPKELIEKHGIVFDTPSKIAENKQAVSTLLVPNPISWADEEKDLSLWLGNELQKEAFNQLYALSGRVEKIDDMSIKYDYEMLQMSTYFYYMNTKLFMDVVTKHKSPYDTPYEAFINYMNIVSDLITRIEENEK